MTADTARPVNHADSFCLMTYQANDGEQEIVYNARDGYAPMGITLRSGKEGHRARVDEDVRVFGYESPPGTRMFVDLDLATARRMATAKAERFPDSFPRLGDDCVAAVEHLAQAWVGNGHMPHLVEVE